MNTFTDEKHYPLGTIDEYSCPEPTRNTYLPYDTVIFINGLFAEALSRLDERERAIYLSFFKRIPQHEIGR